MYNFDFLLSNNNYINDNNNNFYTHNNKNNIYKYPQIKKNITTT